MRKLVFILITMILVTMAVSAAWAQSNTQAAPAAKPSTAAKPAVPAASTKPVAVIDTTAGKMTCTLLSG